MKRHDILVVGRGKLAAELLENLEGDAISRVLRWEKRAMAGENPAMVVHAGSGRELPAAIDYCTGRRAVLFELSTAGTPIPENLPFPSVVCPNVNLQILRFMAMVKRFGSCFKGCRVQIAESHQASKKTKPGTAIYLARSLGLDESAIESERDPERQLREIGIPREHLGRHAWHRITIAGDGVEIRLETRALGPMSYAGGMAEIVARAAARPLSPGIHDVVELFAQ